LSSDGARRPRARGQQTEHQAGLGGERNVGRHADEDPERHADRTAGHEEARWLSITHRFSRAGCKALFRTRTGDPLLTMFRGVTRVHARPFAARFFLQIGLSEASRMRREASRVSFLMCPFCVRSPSSESATKRTAAAGAVASSPCLLCHSRPAVVPRPQFLILGYTEAAARSSCSTVRATSTREETSSLRKMFRMCVSTVLGLRKSVSAISGFVLRSTTSRAICCSRSVSVLTPIASAWPSWVRRWTRRPSRRSSWSAASR
jgi:hypothetical protein